jgi:D-arabinose 1-dehydrogenase-like Zn-dependent alcohol dehydrogenase
MKSYDVCECGSPLRLNERPTPVPQGTEVLLRTVAAGVCHSDIHFWDGFYDLGGGKMLRLADRGVKLPLTMGHENVGEVVALGPDARGTRIGDRRLIFPWIGCGTCGVCRRGEEQLCLAPRFLGVFRHGGYADHIMVPHSRYLLDFGTIPPEQAAPLACSGVTSYGALKKIGSIFQEEPVVIFGAGGLGLMCLAILKAMKGRGAVVIDINPAKREAAKKAGALAVIDPNAPEAAQQITTAAGGGVWAAIDFVGASQTARLGVDCLTKGGKLVVVGLFGGDITLSLPLLPLRAATVQGSYTGSLGELRELVDLMQGEALPYVPTRMVPLDHAQQALDDLKAGKIIGRVVLAPAG